MNKQFVKINGMYYPASSYRKRPENMTVETFAKNVSDVLSNPVVDNEQVGSAIGKPIKQPEIRNDGQVFLEYEPDPQSQSFRMRSKKKTHKDIVKNFQKAMKQTGGRVKQF